MTIRLAFCTAAMLLGGSAVFAQADDATADPVAVARAVEERRIEVVERVRPAVVCVYDAGQRGGGSGVIIDPRGYGLTNFHVVAGMMATRRGLGGLCDGEVYNLEVLGIDPTGDVAMFQLHGKETFPFASLGDSDAVRIGDTAIAMGNPFVLAEDHCPTVTMGLVTGIHRYQWGVGQQLIYSDCIQTDTSINPGNSGGPLFNLEGEVVGINGRISINTRGRFNVGFGYAISSNQIRRFMPAMRAGLLSTHGTLQATVNEIPGVGIVFDEVIRGVGAHVAGIRVGDKLLSFDGVPVRSQNHFASLLGTYPSGWPVELGTKRKEGEATRQKVTLAPLSAGLDEPWEVDLEVNLRATQRAIQRYQAKAAGSAVEIPVGFFLTAEARALGAAAVTGGGWTVEASHHPENREWAALPLLGEGADDEEFKRIARLKRVLIDPSQSGSPLRWQVKGGGIDLVREFNERVVLDTEDGRVDSPPIEEMLAAHAMYLLHVELMQPVARIDFGRVRHEGGDAMLPSEWPGSPRSLPDAEKTIDGLDPALRARGPFEVVVFPVGEKAEARVAFEAERGLVRRIAVRDIPTAAEATLFVIEYRDVSGRTMPWSWEVRFGPRHERGVRYEVTGWEGQR